MSLSSSLSSSSALPSPTPSRFWMQWQLAICIGVVVFGLVLVVAPAFARLGFSWMIYGDPSHIDAFGNEAARYVSLTHAVIGGVMVGWGLALFAISRSWLARGDAMAWRIVAMRVAAWYVPDTSYSLASGFWPNAVLNTVFAALLALPLWGLRPRLAAPGG